MTITVQLSHFYATLVLELARLTKFSTCRFRRAHGLHDKAAINVWIQMDISGQPFLSGSDVIGTLNLGDNRSRSRPKYSCTQIFAVLNVNIIIEINNFIRVKIANFIYVSCEVIKILYLSVIIIFLYLVAQFYRILNSINAINYILKY